MEQLSLQKNENIRSDNKEHKGENQLLVNQRTEPSSEKYKKQDGQS